MMDKLISQQAAIDVVAKWIFEVFGIKESDGTATVFKRLRELPSAQPEHCGGVVGRNDIVQKLNTMDRYVSTELRLCDTDKKFPQNEVFIVDDVYEEIVEKLPSIQPSNDYERGWHDGREALREEMWEDDRDRLDQQTAGD